MLFGQSHPLISTHRAQKVPPDASSPPYVRRATTDVIECTINRHCYLDKRRGPTSFMFTQIKRLNSSDMG